MKLIPADSSRGWQRQWAEAKRDLLRLVQPRTVPLSADAIHTARHELHSFFVQTYQLKDALIADGTNTGITRKQIEDAITASPELALLADLANLDKHDHLSRAPRSGLAPQIGAPTGDTSGGASGWRLSLPIRHGSAQLDGLDVARHAVQAWEQTLHNWGLI
jgi:hypothetical protein